MCVDSANCDGNCSECQHDTIKRLRARLDELDVDNQRLAALVEGRLANPNGYTIIDFLRLWHDQQKERADKADARVAEREAERDRYKGTLNAIVFCAMDYPEAVSMASEALGLEGDVEDPQP